MFSPKFPVLLVAAISILSLPAQADERPNNPLHPSYYVERAMTKFDVITWENYVDSRNPLHPAYPKADSVSEWQATVTGKGEAYVGFRNPLHPKFVRF